MPNDVINPEIKPSEPANQLSYGNYSDLVTAPGAVLDSAPAVLPDRDDPQRAILRRRRKIMLTALVPLLIACTLVLLFGLRQYAVHHATSTAPSISPSNQIDQNTLPTLDTDTAKFQSADSVDITGKATFGGGLVITPSTVPGRPTIGQIYYDVQTNRLRLRDGSAFSDIITGDSTKTICYVGANCGFLQAGDTAGPTLSANTVGASQLISSGVAAGTYGDGANYPVLTVDADGRITSASSLALPVGGATTVGALDTATTNADGGHITAGVLYLQSATATQPGAVNNTTQIFSGVKTFNDSVILAANQSLTVTGGATGSRPASPTEGMVFYDTATKQLLTYANGKWQADRSTATKIVAASNSSQALKDSADYVADGNTGAANDGDQVQINAALTAAAGGRVYLAEGTYIVDETILIPNNTILEGSGDGSKIEYAAIGVADSMIENSDTTTGTAITVRNIKIDGQYAGAGTQRGFYLVGMGGGTSPNIRKGITVQNVTIYGFDTGVRTSVINNSLFTQNSFEENGDAMYLSSPGADQNYNVITNNSFKSNGNAIYFPTYFNYNIISDNTAEDNGYFLDMGSGTGNKITGNTIKGNIYYAIRLSTFTGEINTVSSNWISGGTGAINAQGNAIITDNYVESTNYEAIVLDGGSNSIISNNIVKNSGGTTNNDGIAIYGNADDNIITGNIITDSSCTTTCYAISNYNSTNDRNYFADNRYSITAGTNQAILYDGGTNTRYASQLTPAQVLQSGSSLIKANTSSTLTGTADPAASTTLPGASTKFTTELQVGDRITINSETRTVTAIASDTSLTVDAAFSNTASSIVTRLPAALRVTNSSGTSVLTVNDNSTTVLRGTNSVASVSGTNIAAGTSCSGTNWSGTGPWTHTPGSFANLSCTLPASVTVGASYKVTFTIAGNSSTSNGVSPLLGNDSGGTGANGTFSIVLNATTTAGLSFSQDLGFDGSVSSISVNLITKANSILNLQDSSGVTTLEVRTGSPDDESIYIGLKSGSNDTGYNDNTAVGSYAMQSNISGYDNAAFGYHTLRYNTTGTLNGAVGAFALVNNLSGSDNNAFGVNALVSNVSGNLNTAVGHYSLTNNVTGSDNSGFGHFANVLSGNLSQATAIGANSSVGGSNSISIGRAVTNGSAGDAVGINTVLPGATANTALQVGTGSYNTGTISQTTTAVTGSGTTFTSNMVGGTILYNDGTTSSITAFGSTTSLTVNVSKTVASGSAYTIIYPGGLNVSNTGALTARNLSNSTTALQVQSSGGTPVLTVDTANSTTFVRGINSNAVISGTNIAASTVCTGTNWTGTGPWTHTTGSTVALSCTLPASVTIGATYRVTFTITGNTTSTNAVTVFLGGQSSPELGDNTSHDVVLTASSTAGLSFIPYWQDFNGSISTIVINQVTASNSVLTVQNSSGSTRLEVRVGGTANSFVGFGSGRANASGGYNTGLGSDTLSSNTTGGDNTAQGASSLYTNTSGSGNTSVGSSSLRYNTTGNFNTALGGYGLYGNITGTSNTALGYSALYGNQTGSNNIGVGYLAGQNITTGSNNIIIGSSLNASSATVSNELRIGGILQGDTSTLAAQFNGNLTVVGNEVINAGKSLTVTGGITATRPGGPTEGMVYFDTTTKQLLTYSNGKWQGDRSTATKIVAASNSSQAIKDSADYVADGNTIAALDGDQVQINAALTAAAGGKVYLAEGTYVADATILVPNNTTLAGAGRGTLIELADLDATDNLIEATGTSRTGQIIRDLKIDGRDDLNTAGTQHGIYFNGLGSGTGSSARQGGQILNVVVEDFRDSGIILDGSPNNVISGNIVQGSAYGIHLVSSSNNNTVSGNTTQGNGTVGIYIAFSANNNTVTGNTSQGNVDGIQVYSSTGNTLSGNTLQGNSSNGINILGTSSENNTVIGNTASGNTTAGIAIQSTSSYTTVTGNTTQGNTGTGIVISSSYNTVTGNTTRGNTDFGINLSSADSNTVSSNSAEGNSIGIYIAASNNNALIGNTVQTNTSKGIRLFIANNNIVSNNTINTTGGSTSNNGIDIETSDYNTVIGNFIADTACTTTCYAINITDSTSDTNYLADNTFRTTAGTDQAKINDGGTNTRYASQLTPAQILQSGSSLFKANATSVLTGTIDAIASTTVTGVGTKFTTELQVGDRITITGETRTVTAIATDTSLTVDAATTDTLNDTTPDRLPAALVVKNSAGVNTITVSDIGAATFKNSTNSTTAFQIQNAAGTSNLFNADTTNTRVGIGTTAPSYTLDVAGQIRSSITGSLATPNFIVGAGGKIYSASSSTMALAVGGGDWLSYASSSNAALLSNTIAFTQDYSIDGGATVHTISNSFSGASSIDETAKLSFDFGGGASPGGASIIAGKEGDYTSAAGRSSYLSLTSRYQDANAERLRVTAYGGIGIGTITPGTNRLVVDNATSTDGIFIAKDNGSAVFTIADGGAVTAASLITANGGLTLLAGQNLTVNSDVITDLTGSGLVLSGTTLTVDATSSTGFFQNGGNSFGAAGVLGTNDVNTLTVRTNSVTRLTFDTSNVAYFGNGITSATPSAFTLQGTGGSGTDIAGAAFNLAGGRGTGTGVGGNIVFQYAPAGATGAALNALQTACSISGTNGSLSCPGAGSLSERFGASTVASGANALAVGNGATTSTFQGAIAVGKGASVTADFGSAVGYLATSSTNGVALGNQATATSQSVAIGGGAVNTAQNSTAIGFTTSVAEDSVAVGAGATATALGSVAIGRTATANNVGSIALGYGAVTTAASQFVIGAGGGGISQGYFGNGVTSATPTAFTLQATGGSGTNIAGASFTIAGGKGTGTGVGGNLVFQIAKPGTTGAAANTLATVLTLSGTNGSALFQNSTNNTTAFQIQNAVGTTLLGIDTANSKIFTTIADGASAIGFTLNTPSYTTAGAKLLSVQNNGVEKFAIDKDGKITTASVASASFINEAWTAFTPTWTATGGTPTLGNGTLTGAYMRHGNTLSLRFNLTWGTTTSAAGTSEWRFTYPTGLGPNQTGIYGVVGSALAAHIGVAAYRGIMTGIDATTWGVYAADGASTVGLTVPFTWASTDQLTMYATYELP